MRRHTLMEDGGVSVSLSDRNKNKYFVAPNVPRKELKDKLKAAESSRGERSRTRETIAANSSENAMRQLEQERDKLAREQLELENEREKSRLLSAKIDYLRTKGSVSKFKYDQLRSDHTKLKGLHCKLKKRSKNKRMAERAL
jgi:hypothetical protein